MLFGGTYLNKCNKKKNNELKKKKKVSIKSVAKYPLRGKIAPDEKLSLE